MLRPAVGAADNNRYQQQNIVSAGETSANTGDPDDDSEDIYSATDDDLEDDEEGRAYYRWDPSMRNPTATSANPNNHNHDTGNGESGIGNKHNHNNNNNNGTDLFYDENLDDEDEAYVYTHMRGGTRETATLRVATNGDASTDEAPGEGAAHVSGNSSAHDPRTAASGRNQSLVDVIKPRNSDAVLSCPCCFNIVCMDCQKHKRYANQYRAMFVMGIVVDWNHVLVYDDVGRALVSKTNGRSSHHEGRGHGDEEPLADAAGGYGYGNDDRALRAGDGEYYAVECATCRTQVAALDMSDEVYHFHGCLESSSAF